MPILKSDGYFIRTGGKALGALPAFLNKTAYSSFFILCDENTLPACLPTLVTSCPALSNAQVIEIESGEASKSLDICSHIWQTLLENKADKNTLLINLGGGVVSDLGGFVASVYKRGIDFIHIPTSLLAMADASVGGKTGIDFEGIKNVIGTFTRPKAVFVDPGFLGTLDPRQYQNGLAEIFKMALVSDRTFWNELRSGKKTETYILNKSISLKNTIVLRDPFDKGLRKILNFGHTIGHALESMYLGSEQELLHGEAVVLGMLAESHLAFQKKMIGKIALKEITETLHSVFKPAALRGFSVESLLDRISNDKKTLNGKLLFALPDKIGSCRFDIGVSPSQIEKAIRDSIQHSS